MVMRKFFVAYGYISLLQALRWQVHRSKDDDDLAFVSADSQLKVFAVISSLQSLTLASTLRSSLL